MASDLTDVDALAGSVVAMLTAGGETVALVESCTGGEVGAALTRTPGASACFWGSVVAYSGDAKHLLVGITIEALDAQGTVSEATTNDLAERVRGLARSTYGAAVTGWAGPQTDGPDPVGTVYVAVSAAHGVWARRCVYDGDRAAVRQAATICLLQGILEVAGPDHRTAPLQE